MSHLTDNQSLSVLVVDDDDLMQFQVKIVLNHVGIEKVFLSSDGQTVLNRISHGESFDLLILDLQMPAMDGVEVIRHLAAMQYTGAIALFSGEDIRILKTAEKLGKAHSLRVIGSLTKPVSIESLDNLLVKFHSDNGNTKHRRQQKLAPEELNRAIEQNQIQPFFQPKVQTRNNKIVSVEVLARWICEDGSVIPPNAFIPVAEHHDLIDSLTMTIFEQAIGHMEPWVKAGHEISLAINLCADSLCAVDLPEILAHALAERSIPCSAIILEITESRLMQNLATSLDVLARLRLKGFGLSIDDFGCGYSGMEQLKTIPFTELKIDRSFVHGVSNDPAAFAILESSTQLAKKLGMTSVAEGVEDQLDWDAVLEVGCDLAQGYFIEMPMPADQFEQWLQANQSE